MEALLVWVVERVARFSRDRKFTVGDRLVETCLDITTLLLEAADSSDKHERRRKSLPDYWPGAALANDNCSPGAAL